MDRNHQRGLGFIGAENNAKAAMLLGYMFQAIIFAFFKALKSMYSPPGMGFKEITFWGFI